MSIASANPRRVDELAEALENVRAARPVALRVLQLADDPHADAHRIADAVELDPVLTAQVLKLANSAAFGLSGRVTSTQVAVSALGFSAVRSVATLIAAGLRNLRTPPPDGFWTHTAATAAACSLVGRRFGVPGGDAFALGLLHDLGIPLLHTVDAATYREISGDDVDSAAICEAERREFGMSHAEAAAAVLGTWRFPDSIVLAIACHHDRQIEPTQETMLLAAGDSLAHLAFGTGTPADRTRLEYLGFDGEEIDDLVVVTGGRASEVLAGLPR